MSLPLLIVVAAVAQAPPSQPAFPERFPDVEEDSRLEEEAGPYRFTIDTLLRRGESLLERTTRESVQRAGEMYGYALQIDADSAEAHAGMARAMTIWYIRRWTEDEGLLDRAVAEATKAVALADGDARTHAALAYAQMASESWDAAREEADRAWRIRLAETPVWVSSVYAQSLLTRNDREGALAVTQEALAVRPDLALLHGLHGQILLEMERFGDAIEPLKKALLLEPDYAPAMIRLAFARDRLGDHAGAGRIYERVISRFPEEKPRVYLLMAASLMSRERYQAALGGLEEIQFGSSRGLGEGSRLYLMAVCHEKLGHIDRARDLYGEVARKHPLASFGSFTGRSAAVASYEALARMALDRDEPAEAGRLLEEALALGRPTIDLFLTLSRVYWEHSLREEAVRILERGASTDLGRGSDGRKVEIFVAWARLLRLSSEAAPPQERFAKALETLRRHREALVATGNYGWLVEAARACALMEAPDEALGLLQSAVEMGYRHLDWMAGDPELAPLTRHAGFKSLLPTATPR